MRTLWLEKDKTTSPAVTPQSGWISLLAVAAEGDTFPVTTIKVQARVRGYEWSDTGTELSNTARATTIFVARGFEYRLHASAMGAAVYYSETYTEF